MNVLVVGGGGREHAIALALRKSPEVQGLFCAPGNAGTAGIGTNLPISATDIPGVLAACREHDIGYVVVAPDDPLSMGMVDELEKAGVPAFGPDRAAAIIESSKVFSKNLMKKYNIPSAGYEVFEDFELALCYVKAQNRYPTVIKADGLALGKGVIIADSEAEAEAGLSGIMRDKIFGESGSRVVIEEFLTGPEVSVLCFTDSKAIVPMVSSMDHKRALDGDLGPNTGGMGAIAPNPYYTDELAEICMKTIFRPTVQAMNSEGRPFRGCLYFGLMLTESGPRVIEYNCRFGDPETQVVLPLLESCLLTIMRAVTDGTLAGAEVKFSGGAAACVVLASGGYPGEYKKGLPIEGLRGPFPDDVFIYHAGTAKAGEKTLTSGGRVLGVSARGKTPREALEGAYSAAEKIHFDGMQYRSDIGKIK